MNKSASAAIVMPIRLQVSVAAVAPAANDSTTPPAPLPRGMHGREQDGEQ